jgi:hypothetical protein
MQDKSVIVYFILFLIFQYMLEELDEVYVSFCVDELFVCVLQKANCDGCILTHRGGSPLGLTKAS